MFPRSNFPSGWFPRGWFPSAVGGPTIVAPTVPSSAALGLVGLAMQQFVAYRDRDYINAMAAALAATNSFARVLRHQKIDEGRVTDADFPIVAIRRTGWSEDNEADPDFLIRSMHFEVCVAVRAIDPAVRFEALERLESACKNAIDGQPFLNSNIPPHTFLSDGRDDPRCQHPEQRSVMNGSLLYFLPGFDMHNEVV